MTIEPIGDIADISLTDNSGGANTQSQAQMLARVGHPTERVARESGVSDSDAQYYVRRNGDSR